MQIISLLKRLYRFLLNPSKRELRTGMSPPPRTTAFYLRENRDAVGTSLGRQREGCSAYARSIGAGPERIYSDRGPGVGVLPGLAKLLADVEAGAIDRVIVSDLTRVSRSTSTLLLAARAFRQA